jgi:hypothetical protein
MPENQEEPMQPYAAIADARRPGLAVSEAVRWLLRLAAVERQLLHVAAGHLQGIPEWDAKVTIARHLWEDAEHADQLFARIDQLRGHAEHYVHALRGPLGMVLEEALRARDTVEYVAGVYGVLKPALLDAYRRYVATTNPLADQPTVRMLNFIIEEEAAQVAWGAAALAELAAPPDRQAEAVAWREHLTAYLVAAGGIIGDQPGPAVPLPPPRSAEPFTVSPGCAREERLRTIVPKQFDPDAPDAVRAELIRHFWVRLVELTAAETVATIIYEWEGMPWAFYRDLARHCWDETRHALFGQSALESEGIALDEVPHWVGYAHHQMALSPLDRYAHLAIGENHYLRYPPGARFDYEWVRDIGRHALFARYLDFDWADEVLHSQIGRRWIVQHELGGDVKKAEAIKAMTDQRRREFYEQWARDRPDQLAAAEAAAIADKSDAT